MGSTLPWAWLYEVYVALVIALWALPSLQHSSTTFAVHWVWLYGFYSSLGIVYGLYPALGMVMCVPHCPGYYLTAFTMPWVWLFEVYGTYGFQSALGIALWVLPCLGWSYICSTLSWECFIGSTTPWVGLVEFYSSLGVVCGSRSVLGGIAFWVFGHGIWALRCFGYGCEFHSVLGIALWFSRCLGHGCVSFTVPWEWFCGFHSALSIIIRVPRLRRLYYCVFEQVRRDTEKKSSFEVTVPKLLGGGITNGSPSVNKRSIGTGFG